MMRTISMLMLGLPVMAAWALPSGAGDQPVTNLIVRAVADGHGVHVVTEEAGDCFAGYPTNGGQPLVLCLAGDERAAHAIALADSVSEDHGGPREVRVLVDAGEDPRHGGARVWVAGDEDGPRMIVRPLDDEEVAGAQDHLFFIGDDGGELPKVWIGVRASPLPAPLAAHIGDEGVMVVNVVKGSPADAAGIEQYDVFVKVGVKAIEKPADLVAAIGELEAGDTVKAQIIREGQRQQVQLEIAARPEGGKQELKYEEPQAMADAMVNLRGHALKLDPDGNWIMRDLGPLQGLPDVLKDLKFDFKLDLDALGKDMDTKIFRQFGVDENDEDQRIELRLKINDGGELTTVQRGPDGIFQVTRERDGQSNTESYDSEEAFREGDPEAYELYSSHTVTHGPHFIMKSPGPHGQELRKEFQVNIEQRVKEAMRRAHEAHEEARHELDEVRKENGKGGSSNMIKRYKQRMYLKPEAKGASGFSLEVQKSDDGLQITIEENGEKKLYEYENADALREHNPELYERVKGMLLE